MHGRVIVILITLWSGAATAAEIVDATGRQVQVPDQISHVVPAGPPAAVLLEAVAPDLLVRWPSPLPDQARALLSPDAAHQPQIPRITGRADVSAQIKTLKPDLVLDYSTRSARYADLARTTQQRTGIPTILLDGSMTKIPDTFRKLGAILHWADRSLYPFRYNNSIRRNLIASAAAPFRCQRPVGLSTGTTGAPAQPCCSIDARADPRGACNSNASFSKCRSGDVQAVAVEAGRGLSAG